MTRVKRLLVTMAVLGTIGVVAGSATFSAFSTTTTSSANSFVAGTVEIGDNDAGSFLYQEANRKPGDVVTRCIKVTYTGSLEASVKLYASPVDPVGQYVDLTVTPGSGSPIFPGCNGFVPDAGGAVYSGTLKGFADAHSSYETGLADNPGATAGWVTNDAVVYRLTLTVQDDNAANGVSAPLSTGSHSFTWEARNL